MKRSHPGSLRWAMRLREAHQLSLIARRYRCRHFPNLQISEAGIVARCSNSLASSTVWHWSSSGRIPNIGERIREYTNLDNPSQGGITHGRDGDWVIERICQFSSPDTEQRIIVCYCSYQPIDPNWKKISEGKLVDEMLEALKVGQ